MARKSPRPPAAAGKCLLALLAVAAAALAFGAADRAESPQWRDDAAARLAATALLAGFEADLLGGESATMTLERWCGAHGLASPARVTAERIRGEERPAPAVVRRELGIQSAGEARHRHVRLRCGTHVLSEADNWYVAARLTAEMNRILDTTDEPFGKVVKPLGFVRRTLSAERLWRPLPEGWEMPGSARAGPRASRGGGADARLAIPARVLRVRAVLAPPQGAPFSAVEETYTGELLAFPQPRLPRSNE